MSEQLALAICNHPTVGNVTSAYFRAVMYRPHTPDDSSHLHVKAEFRGKMLYAGNAAAGNG